MLPTRSGLTTRLGRLVWPPSSVEDQVALLLASLGLVAAGILAVVRLRQGEWLTLAVDLLVLAALAVVMARIRVRGTTPAIRVAMVCSYQAAVVVTTFLHPDESYMWAYPCMAATYFLLPPVPAIAVNVPVYALVIIALWPVLEPVATITAVLTLALSNFIALFFAEQNRSQRNRLDELASRDPLTGLFNRRALERDLVAVLREHTETGLPAALVLFDIDHFKRINDTHGHETGDVVLREMVRRASAAVRTSDRLYRQGGEEFVLLTANASHDEAMTVAEKIREAVRVTPIAGAFKVSISAGVATIDGQGSAAEWIAAADEAMYRAKRDGRDRVEVASPEGGGAPLWHPANDVTSAGGSPRAPG